MSPVQLLLLLLPSLFRAQVTPVPTSGVTLEADNSTDSLTNSTGPSDVPPSPSSSLRPPLPSGSAMMPSEAPTELEDDWSPAETFMYTGDALTLSGGRCSRPYSPPGQTGSLPSSFSAPLRPALDALANTANFLNMIFQASDLRESTVQEDMEWYHALVRALLEADLLIQRALLTFDADPTAAVPQLVLRASRNPAAKVKTIILQDLSKAWESLHPPAPAPDDSWFRSFKFPDSNQPMLRLSKRVLLNDLSTLDTPKWRQGDSYVTNRSGVRWASAPFLDCKDGRFMPGWMLILSTSFYGLKPDLTPEFRGVIRVDVNIQDIDLDQCATGDGWFADTHQCNRTTMECVPVPGRGFRLGQYCCRCKEGYYNPESLIQDFDGGPVNGSEDSRVCYPNLPICLPCWPGCRSCQDGAPCWVQEAWLLRAAVLAVQGVFMLLIFVSMLVAYRHRRNRRIRASGLLLLETILFGSLLLYFPVFIMYFKPSTFRCILLRWVRMLGFSIVYGTVTLKMYRVLKVFLSRTAQRVPYMSSLHLLRILGVMLMTVSWFLCAWTVGVLQNRDRNIPVFITTSTSDGQGFNLCYLDRWDYMMAVAELLFLCWGSSLWTAVRPVPSAFHEPRYMGIAIHNELLLSTMFHLFRFTFPSLHPDWMLLLSFTHTHVTITVTLALLFIPKFLYVSKPGREEIAAEVYEDEVDLRRSGSYLNSSFHSAWSEPSVDPEDFRDELKKLYAQLEVHKTKKMTANNPHLSKKRSSRCALGRSIIRRIAEIPETMSRQCSREEKDGSFHSRRVNQSDSFRRAPDTASISYRSSIKSPSPSLRKSQSDHHYVRERNPSLLGANSVKRCSQRSDTDSLDIPPGVCKSASAQNLTIDTNLLHPDHTRLHKSWSLTSTTTHSIENIPKVNRASTVLTRSRQSISISDQTRSALQSESFDKAEICPWELEQEQTGEKNQKHVTYANSQSSEEKGPASPEVLICPWDHLPPVEKTPSDDKGIQDQTDSIKKQVSVSASAPGSPRPKVTKDQRVFSFRTSTSKWLSVRSIMGSMDAASKSSKEGGLNKEDSVSQKSQESASTTPRSGTSSRRPSTEKKSLQKRSMTTTDGKPCLVKQNAVRLSSGDSSDRSPRRLVIVKSAVYPWDVDDMQKDGTYDNVFLSRQNSKRSSISSWETSSSCRTPSTNRKGSYRITPVRNVSHADVCPWEAAGTFQEGEGQKKQQSIKADVCPWESQVSEPSNVIQWESQENRKQQESGRGSVCPWELQDVPIICQTNASMDSKKQQSLKDASNICPWEVEETSQPSKRQDNEYANICPWEIQDKAEVVYENLNPLGSKGSLTVPLQQVMEPAVYPGTSKENLSNEQQYQAKSPALHLGRQATKTTESCPWDFPDPPKIMESICPWEEGSMEPTNSDVTSPMIIKVDICPWETGHQDKPEDSQKSVLPLKGPSLQAEGKDSPRVNICPWETEAPETNAAIKTPSQEQERLADVCPWDSSTPESQIPQTPKTSESHVRQDTVHANVCPWDTEEAGAVKIQVLKSSEKVQIQKKSQEDVCPWETEAPKVLKKQDSSRADVCPWETEDTKVAKKQDSIREDVCPWDTPEPKVLKKHDSSVADVCPWETDDPKVLKKQDSARADVCPWETDDPKVFTNQDSARGDVCPWETDDPKVFKKQDSVREDVCPWETDDTKVLKKQDSARADVCPWETGDQKVLKKQDSSQTDVCPWETEEPELVKKQESSGAEVCPWDSKDPRPSTKTIADNANSDKDQVTENQGMLGVEDTPADTSSEHVDGSKENLALGRRDALCPWEMVRSSSGSFTDNTSDVFTWEPENIPEEDEEDDAECAAEALVFPPDL